MAGQIQSAISGAMTALSAAAVGGKKLSEDEKQAHIQAIKSEKAEADFKAAIEEEAKASAIEADLIKMGADPKAAHSFMTTESLGLDTKGFGMIRGKSGKYQGSYSTLADKLAKGALADSYTSKVVNKQGFAQRLYDISSSRKGRVEALLASEGGKK
mgnify:CR=1 FL=1